MERDIIRLASLLYQAQSDLILVHRYRAIMTWQECYELAEQMYLHGVRATIPVNAPQMPPESTER